LDVAPALTESADCQAGLALSAAFPSNRVISAATTVGCYHCMKQPLSSSAKLEGGVVLQGA
jgi:hypothetical protein